MNDFPSRQTVERLRRQYPAGTVVELLSMDVPYSKLQPGDTGEVMFVDDVGTVHVRWQRGGSLGLVYGVETTHPKAL